MKHIWIFMILFFTIPTVAQDTSSSSGFGMGLGPKQAYGLWGVFYQISPKNLTRSEFNIGVGINKGMVVGAGSKFKLIANNKRYEMLIALNYSYRFSANHRYESNANIDYYSVSDIQSMSYFLTNRFKIDSKFYIQGNLGYSQNISGYSIKHISGKNTHLSKVEDNLNSGFLFGIDVIVLPFE